MADKTVLIKYNCNFCDYHSNSPTGYYQHCKTNKHLKIKDYVELDKIDNKNLINVSNEMSICDTCNGSFKYSELQNHIKKCILISLQEKQLMEVIETVKI
jgi:hypothetical protein